VKEPLGDDGRRNTRQRIMEAGLEELSAGGYSSISMRRVAESSGVTKPTIYYHFGSKKGLFDAMLKLVMAELESLLLRELDSSIGVREALERLLDSILYSGHTGTRVARVNLAFTMDPALRSMFPWMRERMERLLGLISDLLSRGKERGELREGLNTRLASEVLMSVVRTYLLESARDDVSAELPSRREVADILFRGIGRGRET